ncbi:MAG: radical SAM protein [Desulfuromonadaceae bacterium]|nr:radical SAM protein [Desulfuromonadaceae bacterium]MDD5106753.1 radical SAM protein [Desulfuromonadaceae bacterium]
MKMRRYQELGYTTLFNANTGFFARIEDKGKAEPFWAQNGPELLDIAITSWCDKGCDFCYRSAGTDGKHMSLDDYRRLIDLAASIGVYQVALGGGNPNQHPDFIEMLEYTQHKGIVPNYTTNGRGLTTEIIKASKMYCGAVAVSAYEPYIETATAIKNLLESNIKVNVHFVLSSKSIGSAIEWLNNPPKIINGINALIFLNYKPTGRTVFPDLMIKDNPLLKQFFRTATSIRYPFKIGFDSCSISGVFSHTDASSSMVEACDAGRFSMFISEEMKAYPCSFYKAFSDGEPITDKSSFISIWQNSHDFNGAREYFRSDSCKCDIKRKCLNGCPLFTDLKICGRT